MPDLSQAAIIGYTNWKGRYGVRRILPLRIYWGRNQWHDEPQWLLDAQDLDKAAVRSFAVKHIVFWNPLSDGPLSEDRPIDIVRRWFEVEVEHNQGEYEPEWEALLELAEACHMSQDGFAQSTLKRIARNLRASMGQ